MRLKFQPHFCLHIYSISCSKLRKISLSKNSARVIYKPSQSIFIVAIPGFLLAP